MKVSQSHQSLEHGHALMIGAIPFQPAYIEFYTNDT